LPIPVQISRPLRLQDRPRSGPTGRRIQIVINTAPRNAHLRALESNLRGLRIPRHVTIPQDQRLRQMLDSGTYVCERLQRRTRTAVKQLALAVADQLV
jgi:hypothetical protein